MSWNEELIGRLLDAGEVLGYGRRLAEESPGDEEGLTRQAVFALRHAVHLFEDEAPEAFDAGNAIEQRVQAFEAEFLASLRAARERADRDEGRRAA